NANQSALRVGHFQLGDSLGKGAFGSVYRGLNWMSGETVAVKQVRLGNMPRGELREIMAEIDLLKNLKHPNIVKYKGSEKTREYLFIILEYCENGSLQHICKRFGKFPEGLVGVYISQILEGLIYLHDQGVIHRDIKGANILTTKDGSVKLADFGVATKAGSLVGNNAVVGSPYWMAPEVIDQSGATTASDIWSVGCVVIELLEGKPPYHQLDPMPALFRIVQDDCPPLPEGASPVVKDFLLHCFQKDVNLRVSAKKLSKHPWMVSARRQLEQMRSGGSIRGHAEAVKTVKEWNEAINESNNPLPQSRDGKGAGSQSNTSARKDVQRVTNTQHRSATSATPPKPPEKRDLKRTKAGLVDLRQPLATSVIDANRPLPVHYQVEQDTDNWDNDFEEGITTTKLAALDRQHGEIRRKSAVEAVDAEVEEEDNGATIRPSRISSFSTPSLNVTLESHEEVEEDYSDLISNGDVEKYVERFALFQREQGRNDLPVKRLLHPSDLDGILKQIREGTDHSLEMQSKLSNEPGSHYKPGQDSHASLDKYSEQNDEDDFSDLVMEDEAEDNNKLLMPLRLVDRQSSKSWMAEEDAEEDPFLEIEKDSLAASADLEANIARDKHARMSAHVLELFEHLSIKATEDDLIKTCDELELILTEQPEMKVQALAAHGALTVIELLESIQIRDVISRLLGLLNVVIFEDVQAQENLCLIGSIPVVMPFCSKKYPHHVRIEAAHFIFSMCSTSTLTLQFVLSCRGLRTLVELIDEDYTQQRDLVWLGVACVNAVLELQSPASRNDFCRMLAKEGLLEPLSGALLNVLEDQDENEEANSAKEHILQTLFIYSSSDSWMKRQLATRIVLRRLLQALRRLDTNAMVQLLKVLKNLSMSPGLLDEIENCNAIEVLVNILASHYEGKMGTEISNQILNAMYNLCRLNVRRQEEAAQAGLIPHLLRVAKTNSPLKQFALPILCDMAQGDKSTRKRLSQQCGLGFFLELLQDPNWQLQSLESICVWLQGDLARIEEYLLRPTSVQALLFVFVSSKLRPLENLLETFLKIFRLSNSITLALGKQPLFLKRLTDRLQNSTKAIVRLNLLRISKAICDSHPDVQLLMRDFGLVQMIETLSHSDSILVKELAREILSQLHVQRAVRRAASET
ncbi:Pkinase-domain-containing protein, partial [Meira miltonrushii]